MTKIDNELFDRFFPWQFSAGSDTYTRADFSKMHETDAHNVRVRLSAARVAAQEMGGRLVLADANGYTGSSLGSSETAIVASLAECVVLYRLEGDWSQGIWYYGFTALTIAGINRNANLTQLISVGAIADLPSFMYRPSFYAANYGKNIWNFEFLTPLAFVISYGSWPEPKVEVARRLLDHGANPYKCFTLVDGDLESGQIFEVDHKFGSPRFEAEKNVIIASRGDNRGFVNERQVNQEKEVLELLSRYGHVPTATGKPGRLKSLLERQEKLGAELDSILKANESGRRQYQIDSGKEEKIVLEARNRCREVLDKQFKVWSIKNNTMMGPRSTSDIKRPVFGSGKPEWDAWRAAEIACSEARNALSEELSRKERLRNQKADAISVQLEEINRELINHLDENHSMSLRQQGWYSAGGKKLESIGEIAAYQEKKPERVLSVAKFLNKNLRHKLTRVHHVQLANTPFAQGCHGFGSSCICNGQPLNSLASSGFGSVLQTLQMQGYVQLASWE